MAHGKRTRHLDVTFLMLRTTWR